MARTASKGSTKKAGRQVTRDLPPTSGASRKAKGGAVSAHSGGMLVGMGDGSVRMGDGSVVPADGSVRFLKSTL